MRRFWLGRARSRRLPGHGRRRIDLAEDYQPRLEIVTGMFACKGERDRHPPTTYSTCCELHSTRDTD